MPEPGGGQPAAETTCGCHLNEVGIPTRGSYIQWIVYCPLHAAAPRLKEALENVLEAEWMVTHDWGGDRGTILTEARALLREIEG